LFTKTAIRNQALLFAVMLRSTVLAVELVVISNSLKHKQNANLGRNALATLGATTLQNKPTGLGGHPLAEAMATGALEIAGLKCPFHGSLLFGNLISRA